MEVHGEPGEVTYCLSLEATDPHTGSMVALVLEPTLHARAALPLAQRVVSEVRALVLDVLDPSPF